MKINFGHKIAIVYTLFAVGMVSILVMSMQYDHELVTENYYENELNYQGRKDAFDNMAGAPFKVRIDKQGSTLQVHFDGLAANDVPQGTLSLYKPDRAAFDEEHKLQLDEQRSMRLVPKGQQGRYKVQLRFALNGTDYYVQQDIIL